MKNTYVSASSDNSSVLHIGIDGKDVSLSPGEDIEIKGCSWVREEFMKPSPPGGYPLAYSPLSVEERVRRDVRYENEGKIPSQHSHLRDLEGKCIMRRILTRDLWGTNDEGRKAGSW